MTDLIPDRQFLQIAVEDIAGAAFTKEYKFGINTAVGNSSYEDIWAQGGSLSYLTSAETMNIASGNANDGAGDSSGALTVTIEGLNGNWNEVTEDITLNGTNNVPTSETYLRVHRMFVTSVGSNGTNVGAITATAASAATVQAVIPAALGQTEQAIVSIPAGRKAILVDFGANAGSNVDAIVRLLTNENGKGWRVRESVLLYENEILHTYHGELVLNEKTDVRVAAICGTANNKQINAHFSYLQYPSE